MTKEELAEKYKKMGIPMPLPTNEIATTPSQIAEAKGNPMWAKLEAIKKGANKGTFQNIIAKSEKITHPNAPPPSMPVNKKTGQQPVTKSVALESFQVAKTKEDYEIERMLGGGGYSEPSVVYNPQNPQAPPTQQQLYEAQIPNTEAYGPPSSMDYQTKMAERLKEKYGVQLQPKANAVVQQSQSGLINEAYVKKELHELEDRMQDMIMDVAETFAKKMVEEFATKIARETAKDTVKKIIIELAKSGKNIIVESNKVKQAEVVAKDKVKIGGKIYKLTEVKND